MKGLRAAGWGALVTATLGVVAIVVVAPRLPIGTGPQAIGGATYASVAGGQANLVVTSLRSGGAEARAGLRVGDAVTAVNGISHPSLTALREEVAGDDRIAFVVHRDGDALTLTLLKRAGEARGDQDTADRRR